MTLLARSLAGLAAAMSLLAAQGAAAQPAPDAHKLELAKRYFAALHMDQMMAGMMRQVMPAMTASLAKQAPGALTAEQQRAIADAAAESMQGFMAKVSDRMIPMFADTFSDKELQDLVAFYEGPTGQSMLAKMPALTTKMMPLMVEMMPEMQKDLRQRLCSKTDCSKLGPPPAPSKS